MIRLMSRCVLDMHFAQRSHTYPELASSCERRRIYIYLSWVPSPEVEEQILNLSTANSLSWRLDVCNAVSSVDINQGLVLDMVENGYRRQGGAWTANPVNPAGCVAPSVMFIRLE